MDFKNLKEAKLIQTHISRVYLTGKYVYKIKKPVNFGFLDYSTLKKRGFYCQRELKLNRRLSPQVYLKVLPITRGEKIIDWAVMMRQLPQDRIMSNLLRKNGITKNVLKKLARIIAGFHRKAKKGNKKFGGTKTIKFNWNENFKQAGNSHFIKKKVNDFIKNSGALFLERIKKNKIKWCHGDLHSGNVVVMPSGKIYILDCIEFNERFTCQDTASDVAFLAMDLEYFGERQLAGYFVDQYIKYSGDSEILKLLNFYKCYRAFVRGKIMSFRGSFKKAKKYFKLSSYYSKKL